MNVFLNQICDIIHFNIFNFVNLNELYILAFHSKIKPLSMQGLVLMNRNSGEKLAALFQKFANPPKCKDVAH